ncbi:MAG: hypothetical protein KC420_01430 [Myxococcales bacterium]|nr:hypothetical protein [Myxococcales bacterium]MCB9567529.1 hypothetical protein [Myxococcales bacterium]MCB9700600.1 hypothetical protein [Myxococcales bacterium]
MPTAKELFLSHANGRSADPRVWDLRHALTLAKMDALAAAINTEAAGLREIVPDLYEKIVVGTIQIAAHVGVGVGLALEAFDEAERGVSLSMFSREVRNLMTETGVALRRRHANQIAKVIAEIEAQRLAWRHNHEFLSWLAFRRDDPRYSPASRREKLDAFKVRERLLKSREAVSELVGAPLSVALEGHDRFMLANRWQMAVDPETEIERYVWPLLSLQPAHVVRLEAARHELDVLNLTEEPSPLALDEVRSRMLEGFKYQLADAMDHLPATAGGGLAQH